MNQYITYQVVWALKMLLKDTWLWQFEAIAFAPQNPANIAFELPIKVNVGQVSI